MRDALEILRCLKTNNPFVYETKKFLINKIFSKHVRIMQRGEQEERIFKSFAQEFNLDSDFEAFLCLLYEQVSTKVQKSL